jgi:hypothetical protein
VAALRKTLGSVRMPTTDDLREVLAQYFDDGTRRFGSAELEQALDAIHAHYADRLAGCADRYAARATAAEAKLARVVEALEPFAKAADDYAAYEAEDENLYIDQEAIITVAHLREARLALAAIRSHPSGQGSAVQRAREEEREANAACCDKIAQDRRNFYGPISEGARLSAAAIRARAPAKGGWDAE